MKAEFTAFNQYAEELYRQKFLTEEDLHRVQRSIESKSHGFIRDMDELAGVIRLSLARGTFRLEGHARCVFRRVKRSVLPRFLSGALSHVFTHQGELRDDASAYHAATCIQFLSALKRVDPPVEQRKELEKKVWSSLRENFADEQQVLKALEGHLKSDLHFRTIFFRAKEYFRGYMSRASVDPRCAFGPGKNLDRYESITQMDWYVQDPPMLWDYWSSLPRYAREYADSVRRLINYSPRGTNAAGGRYPLSLGNAEMKCSAQPKSYKAFRGVGVTSAYRMALQIALQRGFYSSALCRELPLRDQSEMQENLRQNFSMIGTIDLSSASDRCYWSLLYAFGNGVPFFDLCYQFRTRTLSLPDGDIVCASPVMGEAITFPLMSAFFASLSMSVCDYVGWGHEYVRVYGDDIQHPHYDLMISVLEKVGAKPSKEKSYPPVSYFKESCEAHYVEGNHGMLRNARPAFLPSFSFNFRNRIGHADAYKLLVLAKEAFFRDGAMSRACVGMVERYLPSLELPDIHVSSPYLGRPTLKPCGSKHIVVQLKEEDRYFISSRGLQRMKLRAPDIHFDTKLHQKYQWRLMSKGIRSLAVRDDFVALENDILRLTAENYSRHDVLAKMDADPRNARSIALQYLSDSEICHTIQYVRSQLQELQKVER